MNRFFVYSFGYTIFLFKLTGRWTAFSAGTAPTGYVHPLALKALEEIGILHQGTSKSVDAFRSEAFDLVITVCADAAENCPVWLGKGQKEHISENLRLCWF